MVSKFDVIVIGGGHAGCEAAAATARLGLKTLLVSMDLTKLAQMSCNPAMGGIAKGQIVREIDAIGGLSAIVTDYSSIQFRMLNKSKGPAMWSPRSQCDRMVFSTRWREILESIDNLYLWQDSVTSILIENEQVIGIKTQLNYVFNSSYVVLTSGTFLRGLIHVGEVNYYGGRAGELSSFGITEQLKELGFLTGRMKTGTPVRIDGRTIDYNKLIEQKGDEDEKFFSFSSTASNNLIKRSCFIAHTSKEVHDILKTGFDKSPLFTGTIAGIGPRYCPSIEDKLRTFAEKDSHQLFLEPEGEKTYEMYLNGFSSSLPAEVQYEALRRIEGFENVHILRPGYAIEYDYFPPTQLKRTLETKKIAGLFFAGQVNGTTGYEEAAAQGLIAGINAALSFKSEEPLILERNQAYIGVLIDDLVTKGVDEPYRMFTSRAEHRILLRQDNADERLTPIGFRIGLISPDNFDLFKKKYRSVDEMIVQIKKTSVEPDLVNSYLISLQSNPLSQKKKLIDVVLRPEVSLRDLLNFVNLDLYKYHQNQSVYDEVLESVELRIKYGGYLEREALVVDKLQRLDHIKIHKDFNYDEVNSLSTEAKQKLNRIRPETIGQARRIPGVSPSDISVLLVFLGR